MSTSDTPRTDHSVVETDWLGTRVELVNADFARKLERENSALRETITCELEKCVNAKKKHRNGYCEAKSGYTCGACHFYSGAIQALTKVLGKEAQP